MGQDRPGPDRFVQVDGLAWPGHPEETGNDPIGIPLGL